MTMELWITCLPAVKMTTERQAQLHTIVSNLDDADIPETLYERIEDEEEQGDPRDLLHTYIEFLPDPYSRRDIATRFLHNVPYPLTFTGGITYGEEPNEIFDPMWVVEQCAPLYEQLEEWAMKDLHAEAARQRELFEVRKTDHELDSEKD